MPSLLFNKVFDNDVKKWCVSPKTLQNQNKFLILSDAQAEADTIIANLESGALVEPHVDPGAWEYLGLHQNGVTPIYRLKK